MRSTVLPLVVSVVLLAALPARADAPAGIVMDLAGETSPALAGMAEIPANTLVQLQPSTKLTFLHYARCKLVTVIGGTVTLTRADYKADGKVENEADGPCPRVYSLTDTGGQGRSSGGIISRGLSMAPRWPASPQIAFTGARASTITGAAIVADGPAGQPLQLAITGAWAKLPQGAPPLQRDGHYTLRLTMSDRHDPVDTPFIAAAPSDAGALVVMRVD
jgi:hypothetical protein